LEFRRVLFRSTFPSWARAHPNRLLMHNGEINTIKGNANWMKARTKQWLTDTFGEKGRKIENIIDMDGSDSAMVDNVLEFMSLVMTPEQANDHDSGTVEVPVLRQSCRQGFLRVLQLSDGAMGRPDDDQFLRQS